MQTRSGHGRAPRASEVRLHWTTYIISPPLMTGRTWFHLPSPEFIRYITSWVLRLSLSLFWSPCSLLLCSTRGCHGPRTKVWRNLSEDHFIIINTIIKTTVMKTIKCPCLRHEIKQHWNLPDRIALLIKTFLLNAVCGDFWQMYHLFCWNMSSFWKSMLF